MPAISLYALCRSLSVRFTIRRIAEFSLSRFFFLSFESRIGCLVLDEEEVCGESRSGGFMGLWNERNLRWNI